MPYEFEDIVEEKEYGFEEPKKATVLEFEPEYVFEKKEKRKRKLFTIKQPLFDKETKKRFKETWGFEPVQYIKPTKGRPAQKIPTKWDFSTNLMFKTFYLHSADLWHYAKQFGRAVAPHYAFPEVEPERFARPGTKRYQRDLKRQQQYKSIREYFLEEHDLANKRHEKWIEAHPELQPPEGWERPMSEAIKENPDLLYDTKYMSYIMARNAPFTTAAILTAVGITAATGNPLLGLAFAVGITTPIEGYTSYVQIINAWEEQDKKITPEMRKKAALLAGQVGLFCGIVEVAADLPILYAISKPLRMVMRRAMARAMGKRVTDLVTKKGLWNMVKRVALRALTIELAENTEEIVQGATIEAAADVLANNRPLMESIVEGIKNQIVNVPEVTTAILPWALIGMGGEVVQISAINKTTLAEKTPTLITPDPPVIAHYFGKSINEYGTQEANILLSELQQIRFADNELETKRKDRIARLKEKITTEQPMPDTTLVEDKLGIAEKKSLEEYITDAAKEALKETIEEPMRIEIAGFTKELESEIVSKVPDLREDGGNLFEVTKLLATIQGANLDDHVFNVKFLTPEEMDKHGPFTMGYHLYYGQNYARFKDNKHHHFIGLRQIDDPKILEATNRRRDTATQVKEEGGVYMTVPAPAGTKEMFVTKLFSPDTEEFQVSYRGYNGSWPYATPQNYTKGTLLEEVEHALDPKTWAQVPGTEWHSKEFMERVNKGEENLLEEKPIPGRYKMRVKPTFKMGAFVDPAYIGSSSTALDREMIDLIEIISKQESYIRALLTDKSKIAELKFGTEEYNRQIHRAQELLKGQKDKLVELRKDKAERTPTPGQKVRYAQLSKSRGQKMRKGLTRTEMEAEIYRLAKEKAATKDKLYKDVGVSAYVGGGAWAVIVRAGMIEFFKIGEAGRAVFHWDYERTLKKAKKIIKSLKRKVKTVEGIGKINERELVALALNGTLSDEDVASVLPVKDEVLLAEMKKLGFTQQMMNAYDELKKIMDELYHRMNEVYMWHKGKILPRVKHYLFHMIQPTALELYGSGRFPPELVSIMRYMPENVYAQTLIERQKTFMPANMKELRDFYILDLDKIFATVTAIDLRYTHMQPAIARMKEYIKLAEEQGRPTLRGLMDAYIKQGILMRPAGFDYAMNESLKKWTQKVEKLFKGRIRFGEMPVRRFVSEGRFMTYMFTLSFNLYLAARNLTQTMMMISEIPPDYLGRGYEGLMEMVAGTELGKQWGAYLKDPTVCTILQGRMAVEALDLLRDYMNLRQWQKVGMFIYRMSDKIPVAAAWIGAYQYYSDVAKMPHEDASFYANIAAYKAHYGYRREQLPAFMYRGGLVGATAGTLNTWWLNYFNLFWADALLRMGKGIDITGRKVTPYERIGPLIYVASTLMFLELLRKKWGIDYSEILGFGVMPFFLATTTMYGLVNPIHQAAVGLGMVGAGLATTGWKGYVEKWATGKEPYPLYGYKLRKKGLDILRRSPYQYPLFVKRVTEQIQLLRQGMILRDFDKRAIRKVTWNEWVRRWFVRTTEEAEYRREMQERSELMAYIQDRRTEFGKLCREDKYEEAWNMWLKVYDRYAGRYWEETAQMMTPFPGIPWELAKGFIPRKEQPFWRKVWPK